MRKGYIGLILGALLSAACGGDEAAPPPAAPPPPPPVAVAPPPAPTTTVATPPPAPKPTMAEMQAAAAKTVSEALNAHDAKKYAGMFAEDGVYMMAGIGEMKGRGEVEKQIQQWFDGFKDMKFAFTRAWMKGDMAAYEWAWSGTHTGEFMGMKPTEKQAGVTGVTLVWFNPDGTMKRANQYSDSTTMLTQLGIVKGKARPVPTMAANMDSWAAKGTPEEDKNVDVFKAMMGAMEAKKEADFLATATDDVEWNDMTTPEAHKGKADAKKAFAMLTKAFPDMKSTATTTMGVGDMALVEYTLTGTMKGPMGPIPAKNKPVTMHGLQILQIKDGKVAKGWDYSNSMEMLAQIGMAPKMPAAGAKDAKPAAAGDKKPAAPAGDKKPAAPAGDKKPAEKKPEPAKKP